MKRIIAALLLIGATGAHAATELGEITKQMFLQQKNGTLSWAFMGDAKSPVNWITTGIQDGRRQGELVVSVNGFVPQVIEKVVEDSKWDIYLKGNKFGVTEVELKSNLSCFGSGAISDNCIERLSKIDESLKLSGIGSKQICAFGPGAGESHVRLLTFGKQTQAYLYSKVHGGSAGEFLDISIFFKNDSDVSEMVHNTAVCSILFVLKGGKDSNVSLDYIKMLSH